jgi:hypothetical protein
MINKKNWLEKRSEFIKESFNDMKQKESLNSKKKCRMLYVDFYEKRMIFSVFFEWRKFSISILICCHEMWLLIILRMRKSCINDRTIAKTMIIREEFYSKNVMWSILRYSTCSNHSHILIWRWIILIELIWWFQSLSKNSIIIRARNFIIRLTT